jgi:protease I
MPVGEDFEDAELTEPRTALTEAGHHVVMIGARKGQRVHGKRGEATAAIECAAADVDPDDFDALVIPGGYSPDHLRMNMDAVRLTRTMALVNKPVAAVCHAPSLLIEADLVDDRMVTSWPSVKTDLLNAGARWIDREVVVDGNIITSRNPGDLPAFSDAILQAIADGVAPRAEPVLAPEAASEERPSVL